MTSKLGGGLQPVLSAGQCALQWTYWGASSGSLRLKLSSTVRAHLRLGAYLMSRYSWSSNRSTEGCLRGQIPAEGLCRNVIA